MAEEKVEGRPEVSAPPAAPLAPPAAQRASAKRKPAGRPAPPPPPPAAASAIQPARQRRAYHRYEVDVAADLRVGAEVFAARTRDLSEGGVGLITELPLPDGADIWVSLFLTIDEIEDESTEPLPVPGKIQWATEIEPGVHHLGVKFGEIDPAEREVLRSFLVQVGSR